MTAPLALCFVLVCLQSCVCILACVLAEARLRAQAKDTDNLRARVKNLEAVRLSGLILPPPLPDEPPDRRLTTVWRQG